MADPLAAAATVLASLDVASCAALAGVVAVVWVSHLRLQLARENGRLRDTLLQSDARAEAAAADARVAAFGRRLAVSLLPGGTQPPLSKFLAAIAPHPAEDFAVLMSADGTPIASRGQTPDDVAPVPAGTREDVLHRDGRWTVSLGGGLGLVASRLGDGVSHDDLRVRFRELAPAVQTLAAEHVCESRKANELTLTRGMLRLRSVNEAAPDAEPTAALSGYLDVLLELTPYTRASLFLRTPGGPAKRIASAGILLHAGVAETAEEHERRAEALTAGGVRLLDAAALAAAGVDSLAAAAAVVPVLDGDTLRGTIVLLAPDRVELSTTDETLLGWAGGHLSERLTQLREQLSVHRRATTDGLTGLLNRAELDRRLAKAVGEAREDAPCSLVLFDLDHFKNVNDIHGHAAGDAALVHVAGVMRRVAGDMRAGDRPVLARYGGEELLMLLPGLPLPAAVRIANQVRSEVAGDDFTFNGRAIPLRVSAGVATAPEHAGSVADLLAVADAGLYEAKRRGRNRVECVAARPA